jgi:hypothetical protein
MLEAIRQAIQLAPHPANQTPVATTKY